MTSDDNRTTARCVLDESVAGVKAFLATPSLDLAVAFLGGAYVLMYGANAAAWIYQRLVGPGPVPQNSSWTGVLAEVQILIVSLLITAAAVAHSGRWAALRDWLRGPRRGPRGSTLVAFGLPVTAQLLGSGVVVVLQLMLELNTRTSTTPNRSSLGPDLAHSLMSGGALAEELIVVAAPLVILRYLRPQVFHTSRGLATVIAMLVAARMFYHLYQGLGAASHLLWAYVSILLFVAFGRVWPLIVGHAYYNTVVTLMDYGYDNTIGVELALLVPVVASGVGLLSLRRLRGEPQLTDLPVRLWWPIDENHA